MENKVIATYAVAINIEGLDKLKNLSEKLSKQVSEISNTVQEINHLKLELKINHPKTEDIEAEVSETPSLTDRLSKIETNVSGLEEKLKKANSKLNAIGSKEIGTGCTIHFNKEAFEKISPDLLRQLKLQQSDL